MDTAESVHPTDESLIGFGLGKLDDASGEAVDRHLKRCEGCRRRVAKLSADSFLSRLRDARRQPGSPSFGSLANITEDYRPGASASPPAVETLPPGLADHSDYQVVRELGRGGMGVVYLARNRLLGRDEVLKVMGRHVIGRPGVLERFVREIQAVAQLRHPNIVAAYHAFRIGESIVFAMEHVEGYDLARLVKSRGPLPVAHAAFLTHQAATGLQHAHEEGMVHRDIKPHNLMLSRKGNRGTVKILDFGLAKATREAPVDGGLTHANQMLGSPDFIAPEQSVDAQKADIRADLYSLGCTLYYLLTGGPPFHGTSLYDILQAHHSMDAKPLNFARPEVPVELAALVAKMMAKEPARRPQEPEEVARALTLFFKKSGTAAVPAEARLSRNDRRIAEPIVGRKNPAPSPAVAPQPVATAPAEKSEYVADPQPQWENLIDLSPPDSKLRLGKPVPEATVRRSSFGPWRPKRIAIIGVLLMGMVATGILKVTTQDGVIVLEDLPREADVFIDGGKVRVSWPLGKSAEISVPPGQRGVEVRLDGYRTFGEKVSVESGGEGHMKVALLLSRSPSASTTAPNGVVNQVSQDPSPNPLRADVYTALFVDGKIYGQYTSDQQRDSGWRVSDDLLVGYTTSTTTSDHNRLIHFEKRLRNFSMRAEIMLDENLKAAFVYREEGRSEPGADTRSRGYSVGISGGKWVGRPAAFYRWSYMSARSQALAVPSEYENPPRKQWFPIEVQAVGSHVKIKVGNGPVFEAEDDLDTYQEGRIGFDAWGDGDIKIRKLEIRKLD